MSKPAAASVLALAWRFFRRDLRSPQFLLIGLAVLVAVTGVTAVSSFTARVRLALEAQSHVLLAADLAVFSSQPIAPLLRQQAAAAGLTSSEHLSMRTMLSAGERMQLTELKAVGTGYPLRGSLTVRNALAGPDNTTREIPAAGELWVDARLLRLLDVDLGQQVLLGAATFSITRILTLEPDRAGEFFAIAPRVMMNLADVPATGLVAPGSRVQYALLLAGERAALARFKARATLDAHARLVAPSEARPEVRAALTHAEQFLGLAALTSTALAGIAILLAARNYASARVDAVALLRTFGANRQQIALLVLGELSLLGLVASLLGTALGLGLQEILASLLRELSNTALPLPPWQSAARGFSAGAIAVIGFGLAPLLALRQVPPARILRQDLQVPGVRPVATLLYALGALALLAPWDSGDWRLTAWLVLGFAGVLIALAGAGFGLVTLLGASRGQAGVAWRAGLASLARRRRQSITQIAALGLGIMALLLLGLLRTDLMVRWQDSLPPDAPDQFLINIQDTQRADLQKFFAARGLAGTALFPMVRGRLLAIGAREVRVEDYEDPRAKRLVDREFNLSAGATLKADNRVVDGEFWSATNPSPQFSVEVELAQRLGIKLGDRLRFAIADQTIEAPVTSLRKVSWDSMQVNFFVIATPALLANQPATFITSFRQPAGQLALLHDLMSAFPNLTVIDVGALLTQIRSIMTRVAEAVQFVFLFTLAAGVVVLLAAMQATQAERLYDAVLMKTLGASRALIAGTVAVEFAAIGLCAGVVGGAGAWGGGWLIAHQVLRIDYAFQPLVMASGIALGVLAIVGVGAYAVLRALREPVASALRKH